MIPLYDLNRTRRFPVVTVLLIVVNVVAFLYELKLQFAGGPQAAERLFSTYGVRSAYLAAYATGKGALVVDVPYQTIFGFTATAEERFPVTAGNSLLPLLTSLFLHAGWAHLLGNMWFLWIFGDNVEDRLGSFRFLLFYLAGGTCATLAHVAVTVFFAAPSLVPMIGASGAVSAVLGAYFVAFPRARIVTLIPFVILFPIVQIPAPLFLLFWFVFQQVLPGVGGLGSAGSGGIAFWAHIGGFVTGAVCILLRDSLRRRAAPRPARRGWFG